MSDKEPDNTAPISLCHGGPDLPRVTVDTYNEELRESDGFVGDRASKRAFGHILEEWRERLRRLGDDPFGDKPTEEISTGAVNADFVFRRSVACRCQTGCYAVEIFLHRL